MSGAIHWRCFHCGDTFTRAQERWAREHFGRDQRSDAACVIRSAGPSALLTALRQAEDDLSDYRAEDSLIMRSMSEMQSDHSRALTLAEEAGYQKAIRDIEAGKVEPDHAQRIVSALSDRKVA